MSDLITDRQRFELDLAFFVNGTLDDERRAWMQARLEEFPAWRGDVEFERLTRDSIQSARSGVSAEQRWERLRKQLHDEPVSTRSPARAPPETVRMRPRGAGRSGWAASLLRPFAVPLPALGVVIAVMAVQTYLLTTGGFGKGSGSDGAAANYRSASASEDACTGTTWLRVAVSPAMAVGDWAVALRTRGLTVISGPADGGEWIVRVAAGQDPAAVRQALTLTPGIEEAALWSPPKGGCP